MRHLPEIAGKSNTYFGCDYNEKYIKWCSEYLDEIQFKKNNLKPPLHYADNSFDVMYGISIFTHLSDALHYSWLKELTRVLKKDGITFLTTHGNAHRFKLLPKEQVIYDKGNLIIHEYKKEGNRLFASYQSPEFFKNLCSKNHLKVLKHISGEIKNNKAQQDVWIITPEIN